VRRAPRDDIFLLRVGTLQPHLAAVKQRVVIDMTTLLPSSALISGALIRLKRTRHGLMIYCIHDEIVGRSLDLYGEFSFEELTIFNRMIEPGMTVLDIGANIGVHTLHFAAAVARSGSVIAFEPQGFLHQMLCTNLLLNEVVNAQALHAGIGRGRGEAWVPPIDYSAAGNFGGISLQSRSGAERVPVVSLDTLELAHCHLIKIDVEGMEEDVIVGATETIRKHKPILYLENDRREKSASLIERILGLDYAAYWHLPYYYSPENIYGNAVNVFPGMVSVNMICVPRGRDLKLDGLERITDPRKHPIDGFKAA
jgi:FkbM family methyltransferase